MPHVRKAALVCDRCGARVDIDPAIDAPFSRMERGRGYDGWCEARGRVLCPECAEGWRAVVAENDRRERDYLGIEAVEFDLP